jgi:DNA-directed RNA polymerase specialized sigma24 family protein
MTTSNPDDITRWISGLNAGEQAAAQAIWESYFEKLVRFARKKMLPSARRQADEEDAALSAMHSFYRGMRQGRYENLAGRDELWRLLMTIVLHKVLKQKRRERTLKRGGGRTRGESVFLNTDGSDPFRGIEQALGGEPTADVALAVSENCEHLLAGLGDETLQQIATLKLEGFTNDEIAAKLDCTTRSIERKLQRIRHRWTELGAEQPPQ